VAKKKRKTKKPESLSHFVRRMTANPTQEFLDGLAEIRKNFKGERNDCIKGAY